MSEIAEFTRHLGNYLPGPDVALVERAFHFSDSAHRGQFRKSGEPYITHPLAVASILSQWRIDAEGLAAALLHDVMEDTSVTRSQLETKFGRPVAEMVDGVSKLDQIEFSTREEAQAESFRKMLLAMARDVNSIWSSFDTPSTMSATGLPNDVSISPFVTVVSSITSCSSAAARPCASRRHCDRMLATASGCVMYGSPDLRN